MKGRGKNQFTETPKQHDAMAIDIHHKKLKYTK